MEFLTEVETIDFINRSKRNININDWNSLSFDKKQYSVKYPLAQNLFNFSFSVADKCIIDEWSLLYIHEEHIFSSNENTNLYYSLRKFHGDYRSIYKAPGHIFFKHEKHDLASFISIAIMNLYDCIILSDYDYYSFHLSHDEFLDIFYENSIVEEEIKKEFDKYI
jgi:hypothetical protein